MWVKSQYPVNSGHGYMHWNDAPQAPRAERHGSPAPIPKSIAWSVLADAYVRAVKRTALIAFAASMNLKFESLVDLHTGWDGDAWTTPMRNATGRMIGLQRRFVDGTKLCWLGSRSGLFIPDSLNGENPVFIAEGASDTAALVGIGLPTVGLFNAGGNAEQIIRLLAGRGAVLVADNDARSPKGRTGGRERTAAFARRLRAAGIRLRIVHPPAGVKDAREWVRQGCDGTMFKPGRAAGLSSNGQTGERHGA